MTSPVLWWLSVEMLWGGISDLLILLLLVLAINPSEGIPLSVMNGEGTTVCANKVNRITDSNKVITANVFVFVSWISFLIPPVSVEGRLAVLMTALLVEANISNNAHSEEVMCNAVYGKSTKGPCCITKLPICSRLDSCSATPSCAASLS